MVTEKIKEILKASKLTIGEIDSFSELESIHALLLSNLKFRGEIHILFDGFPDFDNKELSNKAIENGMIVKSKVSPNISFLCSASESNTARIEKALSYGVARIDKKIFLNLCQAEQISFSRGDSFINHEVSSEYRIFMPFKKYDVDHEVESLMSSNVYKVNIANMTCTCLDFVNGDRGKFKVGDLRRLCKHLVSKYYETIGIIGLSEFNKILVQLGFGIKENYKFLEIKNHTVVIGSSNNNDWWDVFIKSNSDNYKVYNYNIDSKNWSYGEAPRGLAKLVKEHFPQKSNFNKIDYSAKSKQKDTSGCATIVVIFCIIVIIFQLL